MVREFVSCTGVRFRLLWLPPT